MADRQVTFDILARDRASKVLTGVGSKFGRLGSIAGSVGKGIALAAGGVALGGVAALSAGLVQGVKDAAAYQTLQKKTEAVLKSTGNAARTSVKAIQARAGALESLSGVDETLIINSQNVLATFTKVSNGIGKGNNIFDRATESALNMSVALGTDLQGTTLQVGKALNDPIKGITALSRAGVSFTAQQKDQIKAMVAAGDTMGAQKMILAELNKEFGGAAKAAGSGFEGSLARLKDGLSDFGREVGTALLPHLTKLVGWLTKKLPGAIQWTKDTWAKLSAAFDRSRPKLQAVADKVKAFAGWIKGDLIPAIKQTVQQVMPLFRAALDNLKKAFGSSGKGGGDWGARIKLAGEVIKGILKAVVVVVAAMAFAFSVNMRASKMAVDKILIPAIKLIWKVFSSQVGLMLNGAAKAFGWIPGLGPKLKKAADDFNKFTARVNASLGGLNKNININIRTRYSNPQVFNPGVNKTKVRAHGGGVMVGASYQVNEDGQEILKMSDRSAAVIPHAQSQRMLKGASGGGDTYIIQAGTVVPERDLMRLLDRLNARGVRAGTRVPVTA